jgi:hypothetical protein
VWVVVSDTLNDAYRGARRVFIISSWLADALEMRDGALCELLNPRGPSLRGWVCIDAEGSVGSNLPLGPFARAILRCSNGDRFELRSID